MAITLPHEDYSWLVNGEQGTSTVLNRTSVQSLANEVALANYMNTNLKETIESTSDPTGGDDEYEVGALWVNTSTDTPFICTDNSTGTAVWINLTTGGSGASTDEFVKVGDAGTADFLNPSFFEQDGTNHIRPIQRIDDNSSADNRTLSAQYIKESLKVNNLSASVDPDADNDTTEGYNIGSLWLNNTSPTKLFYCGNNSDSAAIWPELKQRYLYTGTTNSSASVSLSPNGNYSNFDELQADEGRFFQIRVFGKQTGGSVGSINDVWAWKLEGIVINNSSAGEIQVIGTVNKEIFYDPDGTSAGVDVILSEESNTLDIQVNGATNRNISWIAEIEFLSRTS